MSELNFLQEIELIITGLGYECVHAGIKTEFGRTKLQVLIDTLGGINAGDCELVSGHVNKFLDDNADSIPALDKGRYYLEVSSPGIERPLYKPADYQRFQEREARVRLNNLLEGRKTFTGVIKSADSENLTLLVDNETKIIPFELIKGGNLVFRFENENNNSRHNNNNNKHRRAKK
ncbi:MAG: ribosome maturation factor RimP [Synergistaceae bacterium]|nr:ribosome maturation factor RimP [Synergistaceae bacterium]